MDANMEQARVTELHVRMDCNGCVQKIKKALHNVDGVQTVSADFFQQKLTVVGPADPERLVKAIKKMKKTATVCSQTEPSETQPPASEPAPPEADATNQPGSEAPPANADQPTENSAQENPPASEPEQSPETQKSGPDELKDVGVVHMVHDYPHSYPPNNGHAIQQDAPYYVTYSYNTHRPMANASEYRHVSSNAQAVGVYETESYSGRYYQNQSSDGNQISSMFSDENPNACRIV